MAAKKNKVAATPKKTILNNRYERGGSLGSGAFGTIYKGNFLNLTFTAAAATSFSHFNTN